MDTSKLKPFNLERALAGDPVVTRTGFAVKIAGYNESAISGRLLGWIIDKENGDTPGEWCSNGRYLPIKKADPTDLFMAPKAREVWVNIYAKSNNHFGETYFYKSQESADAAVHEIPRYGNCAHKITIEE